VALLWARDGAAGTAIQVSSLIDAGDPAGLDVVSIRELTFVKEASVTTCLDRAVGRECLAPRGPVRTRRLAPRKVHEIRRAARLATCGASSTSRIEFHRLTQLYRSLQHGGSP